MRAASHPFAQTEPVPPPAVAFSDASDTLLDAAIRLVRLLDQPRDREVLAPLVKREILWRLITSEHGATVRRIGLTDTRLAPIAKALRWIRENYKDPFQVEDLAALVGMSASAFHRNFQAVAGTTPIQFQKKIRLQEEDSCWRPTRRTSQTSDTSWDTTARLSSAGNTTVTSAHRPAETHFPADDDHTSDHCAHSTSFPSVDTSRMSAAISSGTGAISSCSTCPGPDQTRFTRSDGSGCG
ncbi:hypothetical protein ABIA35_006490 [Catenulispora sp. MAP12-49]